MNAKPPYVLFFIIIILFLLLFFFFKTASVDQFCLAFAGCSEHGILLFFLIIYLAGFF